MQTLVIDRADINNPLHPSLWENMCDDLGLAPACKCEDYPDRIVVTVSKAERDD